MEVAGLTVGIVGLAGFFNNAVDCFEYIQLGRNFGTNFQTSLLKLDNGRLRLSRWGEAVGLSGEVQDVRSLQQTAVFAQDTDKAEKILGKILELFALAEGVSASFKSGLKPDDSTLLVHDAQAELDPVMATLHQKMRELSIKRQNRTPLRQKAKWALYEEKHFRKLIEDVVGLINDLVELFPAAKSSQQELCKIEVAELGTGENLPALKEIVVGQDQYLEAAISKALKADGRGGNWYNYNSKIGKQVESEHIHGNQNISF